MATTATTSNGPLNRLRRGFDRIIGRYRELGAVPETRRLLGAAAGSYIGDRFNTIALIALSFKLGDSALGVGGMLAMVALPRLVVQAASGALVDRYPGKRLLVASQLVMGTIAACFLFLDAFPSLWLLYALTFAMGVVRTVDMPAFEVRLMALTPTPQRGVANAVHMLAMTAGELVGPLLGGLVLALVGANPLFIVNALSFVIVASIVASLPERVAGTEPEPQAEAAATGAPTAPPLGYRALLRRSDVALYTGMVVASCILILGAIPLFIVRANDLGLGGGGVGLFYATMGVGTLFGGIVAGAGSHRTRRALAIAALASIGGTIGLILFGAANSLLLALPALALFGLSGDLEEIAALTYFQHRLPDRIYGRFFSLFLMATGAGGLVGALAGPGLAEAIGTGRALTLLALPTLVLAVVLGIREGGLRVGIPVFAPLLEPEVAAHGMFGVPSESDFLPDGEIGGRVLQPRLHRLV